MYNEIVKIASALGKDPMDVFKDLLRFTVLSFTVNNKENNETWDVSEKESKELFGLLGIVLGEYNEQIKKNGWADPWGECYESLISKAKASTMAQFFTPRSLCDLMSGMVMSQDCDSDKKTDCGAFGRRMLVSDPTCGSGRNLLAIASKFSGKPQRDLPYFVGEDLDEMCVMMTAVNLMMHGVPGEVICHNTLTEPDGCKFGYIINEGLFPIPGGLPTIRKYTNPMRFLILRRRIA